MKITVEMPAEIKKQGSESSYYEDIGITINQEDDANKLKMQFISQVPNKNSLMSSTHFIELIIEIDELKKVVDFFKPK